MSRQEVLRQILTSENRYSKNVALLKKIMFTVYLSPRFRINNLAPDSQFSLREYFFDEERMIFDFTRLSDRSLTKFKKWLLAPHQKEKIPVYLSDVETTEYRGFTAEVSLNWWGQFKNWFFDKQQDYWPLADPELSLDYQLTGIEICEGKKGLLIGLNQFLVPKCVHKYRDPNNLQLEPMGNTKRVYLTDSLVNQLIHTDIHQLDFSQLFDKPHLHSVDVLGFANDLVNKRIEKRCSEMHNYRQMQHFNAKPWYLELWEWCCSWFIEPKPFVNIEEKVQLHEQPILEDHGLLFLQRQDSEEIIVYEFRPELDITVFSGGGAKIYGHIGVMKAFEEAGIKRTRFAGSSAGAMIALLNYLGYKSDYVIHFFDKFKQENLIYYDIDRNGLSDTKAMKAAIDFVILEKIEEIVNKYEIPYPRGPITFATLDVLSKQFPDCGIGSELQVTATNKSQSKTEYFSNFITPFNEVSEVITASACLPPVYKASIINGNEYTDGGIKSNFPTEKFIDDNSTFLEAEGGNNLRLFGCQFDNGTERSTVDKVMEQVYKENPLLNYIYKWITGIDDPASGWEQDRLKLRQYALQTVVVNVGEISSTNFNLSAQEKTKMIQAGYDAAKEYIETRYCFEDGKYINDELMYTSFSSIKELLSYCCYRNQKKWFIRITELIESGNFENKKNLLDYADELHQLYFTDKKIKEAPIHLSHDSISLKSPENNFDKMHYDHFRILYPLLLSLSSDLLGNKQSKAFFEKTRHNLCLQSPLFSFTQELAKITGEMHAIFYFIILLFKELNSGNYHDIFPIFGEITQILQNRSQYMDKHYFANWRFTKEQGLSLFGLFKEQNVLAAKQWCNEYKLALKVTPEKIPEYKNPAENKPFMFGRVFL